MVAVSYTVLVLNELIMVAIEITTWHPVMILSILGTFLMFVGSIPFLGGYFDLRFVITWYVYIAHSTLTASTLWESSLLTVVVGALSGASSRLEPYH
jgi:hypothetical protein